MGRDQDQPGEAGQFEWVNVWAEAFGTTGDTVSPKTAEPPLAREPSRAAVAPAATAATGHYVAARSPAGKPRAGTGPKPQIVVPLPDANAASGAPLPADQLMRDIAEIERARDALMAGPFSVRRLQTFMVVPARTTDSVPLVVGGVLALVMLTMLGGAAAFTKLGR